jgi:hypothetical protein
MTRASILAEQIKQLEGRIAEAEMENQFNLKIIDELSIARQEVEDRCRKQFGVEAEDLPELIAEMEVRLAEGVAALTAKLQAAQDARYKRLPRPLLAGDNENGFMRSAFA